MGTGGNGVDVSKSLYSDERICWICHSPNNIHKHHVYGGVGRRPISEREGCWLYLCGPHHNLSDFGIHFDKQLDKAIKEDCERRWCKANDATPDDFRAMFGVNYI